MCPYVEVSRFAALPLGAGDEVQFFNIYIFIAIDLDETSILVAVYFSMKNIYQSCDLVRAVKRSNVDISQ